MGIGKFYLGIGGFYLGIGRFYLGMGKFIKELGDFIKEWGGLSGICQVRGIGKIGNTERAKHPEVPPQTRIGHPPVLGSSPSSSRSSGPGKQ